MTDRDALLAAILADPDDNTARLVYADWLQENGQTERAEFIRAQIEAAGAEPFGVQARQANQRATKLLDVHRTSWIRHLHGGFAEWPRFERGFVAHLSVEPGGFVPRADALFDAEPVQSLKLFRFAGTGGPVPFRPLFELPRLRQLRRLELSSRLFTEEEYGELSACPYLAGLRELSLRDNPVPPTWLAEVLRNRFPELTALDVADIPNLGPCLAESLPQASHRQLMKLDLSGVVYTTSEQLQRVLKSRCLRQVQELRLGRDAGKGQPGPLFYLDLSFVIPWERLVVLDLAGQRLGNEAVREITARKEAAALRWLGLAHNDLGPDAVLHLVESSHLTLNYLNVEGNNLTLSDKAALQRRFPDAVIES
jgi:uncharacterized protein (TIGR02996 family)